MDEHDARTDRLLARLAAQPFPHEQPLSPAERRVLEYLSRGLTQRMIGDAMQLGRETVKDHAAAARAKLNAKNSCHACCEAIRRGLIP